MDPWDIVPRLWTVPTRITDKYGKSILTSRLTQSKQEDLKRHVGLRNELITFMNYFDNTSSELTKRLLLVSELDHKTTEWLEINFGLPVTGDHNKLFENYRHKYYSRRSLNYHNDPRFVAIGAAIVDDVDMMERVLEKFPDLINVSRIYKWAAQFGSFKVLKFLFEILKTNCGLADGKAFKNTKMIHNCLVSVIKYGDLDIINYLIDLSNDCKLGWSVDYLNTVHETDIFREAVKTDQVDVLIALERYMEVNNVKLLEFALSYWSIDVFKYLVSQLGNAFDRGLCNSMLEKTGMYGTQEIFEFLTNNYQFILQTYQEALNHCATYNNIDLARLIFERVDGVDPDAFLINSAAYGHLGGVKLAIEFGATEFSDALDQARADDYTVVVGFLRSQGYVKNVEL